MLINEKNTRNFVLHQKPLFQANVSPLSVLTKHLFLAPVASNFLLTTDVQINGIYQIDLENKNISAVDVLAGNPNIPDYDNVRRKLVWWDKSKNIIMKSSLDGTDGKAVKGIIIIKKV